MSELGDALDAMDKQLEEFARNVDVDTKGRRIVELEGQMSAPGFWDRQTEAQATIAELKAAKGVVEPYRELRESVDACRELLELAADDPDSQAELATEVERMQADYAKVEITLALSGPYDASDIYLSIQAGAGGTDACDWAEMMVRMYSNYCQRAGYQCELMDHQPATEAGIKSATLYIRGANAYGYFKSEMGTHRLVRMSPFNSSGTRETSFAAVEVTPELPEAESVNEDDLDMAEFRIDTYRASGAGGQHVNKTDSAVRVTHIPTNVVVSCQTERSQIQNRGRCWKMMVAKLQQLKEAERLDELKDLAGDRGTIGWGHQIRSYVLQPTQLITDLRTRFKEGNANKVLDGDLQDFIDSYLQWRLKQGGGHAND
ncbi:MAG: peptide chain release factor 2 [Planctomycetota bacterium]|jgi:peptide chain release factor 2|nr:peptide chain release factor 2 [Planctomycetota bacterium]